MALKKTDLAVGAKHEQVVVSNLTRGQIVQYAGASGDYNPVHTDEIFVTKVVGYPSVFAHGMLTMGMTAHMLTDHVGDGRLTEYGVRFTKQVFPGDTLTASCVVKALRTGDDGTPLADFDVVTTNQQGDPVLSGHATARIDD